MRNNEMTWDLYEAHRGAKQYKYLYQRMLDRDVIRLAYKKLRKGKTKRREIIAIDANFDAEVEAMREMILNTKPPGVEVEHPELAYKPHKRTPKIIYEHNKARKIFMPEIHEQWLHHIIVLVVEPIIVRTSYQFSCGSFPNRGAHKAKRQLERWIRAGKGIRHFAKIDIRHFYDSIRLRVLIKELSIRIKDEWFLYIIELCLKGFKKGIPLGFYISQWLANYLLEPLDYFITETLGFKIMVRYMDDIVFMGDNKKKLHAAIIEIKKFLGRRFRLKLKRTFIVAKFIYHTKTGRTIGRRINYMGFLFDRDKTTVRKCIMLQATRLAARLSRKKQKNKRIYHRHVCAMVSYMGWFNWTDTYNCYLKWIKPYVNVGKLKRIISKLDRRKAEYESMERGTLRAAA